MLGRAWASEAAEYVAKLKEQVSITTWNSCILNQLKWCVIITSFSRRNLASEPCRTSTIT